MSELSFPVGCPPLPELLERLQVRPEHDSSRYSDNIMSAAPAGLPDYGNNTGAFAPAVKKYQAYLKRHPEDAAGWEGLSYLHLRIASGQGKGTGMGAEGLVSQDEAGDPLRAGHRLLSFQAELQALLCEPGNLRFRRSLNTTLSLALHDAVSTDPTDERECAPIVRCLGGQRPAQELRYALVEGMLELRSRRSDLNDLRNTAELLDDQAEIRREMGLYREAIALYLRALQLTEEALARGERVFLRDRKHYLLWLHVCALEAGDFPLATHYLNELEAEEQRQDAQEVAAGGKAIHTGGPATHLRLKLLEAEGKYVEAQTLALQNADMLLKRHEAAKPKNRDTWDMLRCADLLHYAGQHAEARELLRRNRRTLKDDHSREYAQRLLTEIEEGTA